MYQMWEIYDQFCDIKSILLSSFNIMQKNIFHVYESISIYVKKKKKRKTKLFSNWNLNWNSEIDFWYWYFLFSFLQVRAAPFCFLTPYGLIKCAISKYNCKIQIEIYDTRRMRYRFTNEFIKTIKQIGEFCILNSI